MANSKLHDDLVNEVEPLESPEESVASLMNAIARRIEGCDGNKVKLSDLATVLRENPEAVGKAVLANTPAASTKVRTTGYDAPSTVFDKPATKTAEQMKAEKDATDKKAADDKAAADKYRADHMQPAL